MEPHWNLLGSIALLKANAMQSLVSNVIGLYMVWQNKTLQCTMCSLNFLIGRKHQLRCCKFCQINGNDITGLLEPQPLTLLANDSQGFPGTTQTGQSVALPQRVWCENTFLGRFLSTVQFWRINGQTAIDDGYRQNATVKWEWHQEMSTSLTSDSKCSSWLVFFSPRW